MSAAADRKRRIWRVRLLGVAYLAVWVAIVVFRGRYVLRLFEAPTTFEKVIAIVFLILFPLVVIRTTRRSIQNILYPPPRAGMGTWALAWRTFKKKPRGVVGLTLLGFVYLVAFLCPVLADYGPTDTPKRDTRVNQYRPPGTTIHVFAETRKGEFYGVGYRSVAEELAQTKADLVERRARREAFEQALPPEALPSEAVPSDAERTEAQQTALVRHYDQVEAREARVRLLERAEKRGGGLVLDRVWDDYLELYDIGKPHAWKRLGVPKRGWIRDADAATTVVVDGHEVPYRVEHHVLGTDDLGRDLLSRIIYGSRISLTIGFFAMGVAVTLGTLFGVLSGFFGGAVDALVMRFVDVLLAFPRLLLLLLIITIYSQEGIWVIVLVLGATGWMGVSRLVRAEVLRLKELDFVAAARVMGFSKARIMFRHLVPNAMAPVIVAATLMVGTTILVESALSFLGMGVPPEVPTWGNIVFRGSDALGDAWWISTIAGLAIVVTVVCFNLAGDALRDALDPRQRF